MGSFCAWQIAPIPIASNAILFETFSGQYRIQPDELHIFKFTPSHGPEIKQLMSVRILPSAVMADGRTGGRTDGRTIGRTNGRTDGWTGRTDGRMDGRMDGRLIRKDRWTGRTDGTDELNG